MIRAGLLAMMVLGAACSKKSDPPAPAQPPSQIGSGSSSGSGSGSATPLKVVALTWKTPEGDPLASLAEDGTLEGPCGPIGKVAGNNVLVEGQTFAWTEVVRKDGRYSMANLPWVIELAPGGTVSVVQKDKPAVPLGTVTGTESEDGKTLFAALVVAAPLMQIKLAFIAADKTEYQLVGAADSVSWRITTPDHKIIKEKRREDPDPEVKHPVTEAADGTVIETATKRTLGKLIGRKSCKPHDKAVTALIETYLAR